MCDRKPCVERLNIITVTLCLGRVSRVQAGGSCTAPLSQAITTDGGDSIGLLSQCSTPVSPSFDSDLSTQ